MKGKFSIITKIPNFFKFISKRTQQVDSVSEFISPELIERFNKAAQLAREGKYEESLAEWNLLLFPSKEEKRINSRMMSGHFLGIAMMRRAWVLIDLKNYKEAKNKNPDRHRSQQGELLIRLIMI